jgi:hypothetical protein
MHLSNFSIFKEMQKVFISLSVGHKEMPIALSYLSPNAGEGGVVTANEYSCAHGAPKNFGDLAPYLTYVLPQRIYCRIWLDQQPGPAVFHLKKIK